MIIGNGADRYGPKNCNVGILHQPLSEQRRFMPRGYHVPGSGGEEYWESVTEVKGVLLPHQVRSHLQQGGERDLLMLPYEEQIYYALGPLIAGQTIKRLFKPQLSPDLIVPADTLTPYPFDDIERRALMQPYLEHPFAVQNVAIDLTYDNPHDYSYELCT